MDDLGAAHTGESLGESSSRTGAQMLDAGFAAFAATAGALFVFGAHRGGALGAFAEVGRRVARDVSLPPLADAAIGLAMHVGHSLALGAVTVLVTRAMPRQSRVFAAVVTVIVWQTSALIPWVAVTRPDLVLELGVWARAGLALLLGAALMLGPRRP